MNNLKFYRKKETKEVTHEAQPYRGSLYLRVIGKYSTCLETCDPKEVYQWLKANNFEEVKMTNNNENNSEMEMPTVGRRYRGKIEKDYKIKILLIENEEVIYWNEEAKVVNQCAVKYFFRSFEELPEQDNGNKQVETEKKTQEELPEQDFSKNCIDQAIFESKAALNNFDVNCARSVGELKYKLQNLLNELNFGKCEVCAKHINNFHCLKNFGNYVCSFECQNASIKKQEPITHHLNTPGNAQVEKAKEELRKILRTISNDPSQNFSGNFSGKMDLHIGDCGIGEDVKELKIILSFGGKHSGTFKELYSKNYFKIENWFLMVWDSGPLSNFKDLFEFFDDAPLTQPVNLVYLFVKDRKYWRHLESKVDVIINGYFKQIDSIKIVEDHNSDCGIGENTKISRGQETNKINGSHQKIGDFEANLAPAKSIWKPVSELPNLSDISVYLKMKVFSLYGKDQERILFGHYDHADGFQIVANLSDDDLRGFYRDWQVVEWVELTGCITHQEELEKRIERLEQKEK